MKARARGSLGGHVGATGSVCGGRGGEGQGEEGYVVGGVLGVHGVADALAQGFHVGDSRRRPNDGGHPVFDRSPSTLDQTVGVEEQEASWLEVVHHLGGRRVGEHSEREGALSRSKKLTSPSAPTTRGGGWPALASSILASLGSTTP